MESPPLSGYLSRMCLFAVNTGCREQEVCRLDRSWWFPADGAFVLPASVTKSGTERVVLLNATARSVVGEPGMGRVFTRHLKNRDQHLPVQRMHTSAWNRAWQAAGLPSGRAYTKGVHNLRHTFARRLRAAGVSEETRRALLGHKTVSLTTHYSAAELDELRAALALLEAPGAGKLLRAVS